MVFFDDLETRSDDQRSAQNTALLKGILKSASDLAGYKETLSFDSISNFTSLDDLTSLPVLRKSELSKKQSKKNILGGYSGKPPSDFAHIFQSPGPIYEPGDVSHNWWRIGRFLHALNIGKGDIVHNCSVVPAGVGQTELQVKAASDIGSTAYAGTPDYLKVILDKADEMGVSLSFTRAAVGGGALFPSLRQEYLDRGIICRQNYATADLGNIAYETEALDGMVVDEGVIVEIVTPGTGNPVPLGEVGEVLVTSLNADYPLIRFATGDLSAFLPGKSSCGRTNIRIKGWMGRADQTTKIKGLFVRPEQVADLVSSHKDIQRARIVATREGEMDVMTVKIETENNDPEAFNSSIISILKLKGIVELVSPGSLPRDGLIIEDLRKYD